MQVIRRVDKGSGEVLSVSITPAGRQGIGRNAIRRLRKNPGCAGQRRS